VIKSYQKTFEIFLILRFKKYLLIAGFENMYLNTVKDWRKKI